MANNVKQDLLGFHQRSTVLVPLYGSSASFSAWGRISSKLLLLKFLNHGVNLHRDDNYSIHVTSVFSSTTESNAEKIEFKAESAQNKAINLICNGQYAQYKSLYDVSQHSQISKTRNML